MADDEYEAMNDDDKNIRWGHIKTEALSETVLAVQISPPPTFNGIGLRNLVTHRDIDSPTPLGHFCTTLRFEVSGKGVLGLVSHYGKR